MVVNVQAMHHLAESMLSCALLAVCSQGGILVMGGVHSVTSAVRWASFVILLSAVYYLQIQVCIKCWQRKRERRMRRTRPTSRSQYQQAGTSSESVESASMESTSMEDADLDAAFPRSDDMSAEVWVEGGSVVSNNVYYPELTMSSVWTYVYGWGILLFVCVYCLAGLDVPCSCWWVMGMVALSFDELVSKGVSKCMICLLGVSLCVSIFSVWSGALIDNDGNFLGDLMFSRKDSVPLLNFVMGVVLPVSTPFVFFSIRSTVRSMTQDVFKLCEFALPFMTVLAGCCLVAMSGVCDIGAVRDAPMDSVKDGSGTQTRRGMLDYTDANTTAVMVETVAKFASSYTTVLDKHSIPINGKTFEYALVFISPLLAFWVIRVLVVAILHQRATEFIVSFALVTAARFGMMHAMGVWSALAISGAGFAFVLLLFGSQGRR
jgi:hypothetical protein